MARARKPERRAIEDALQRELLRWAHITYPELEIVHIRNEQAWKGAGQIAAAKLGGYTVGYPDLLITVTHNNGYTFMLHLELKKRHGTLNDNQIKWHAKFVPTINRKLATAYGLVNAQKIITEWQNSIRSKRNEQILPQATMGADPKP